MKKKVWILLTQHDDLFARIVRFITRSDYTHASIGLEDDYEKFYTFNMKVGFYVEQPNKIYTEAKRKRQCRLYTIEIEEKQYNELVNKIKGFECNAQRMKYNFIGLIMSFFHFSWERKNHYFCSQFVAATLIDTNVLQMDKHASLYLPNDFTKVKQLVLSYSGSMGELHGSFL